MSPRRLRLAVPLAALALAASACGFKHEPVGALPSFPRRAQDGQGRTVTVSAQPTRIVSLDAGLTETAFAVGAGDDVVAATGDETYPPAARRLPAALDSSGRPEAARIRRLRPDLILAPQSLAGEATALGSDLKVPVYVGGDGSLHDIEHDIAQVGVLTGFAVRGRTVVQHMQERVAAIRKGVSTEPPVRVFVDNGFFYTIDPTSPAGGLITLAGGVDVAADAQPGKPYPLSKLRAAKPQAYLAVAGRGTTLAGLRTSRATKHLPAVRSGRFLLIDANALSDRGPRVVATLRQIAHVLHPNASLNGR
jgi:iron complex transport system substrate-binding protein